MAKETELYDVDKEAEKLILVGVDTDDGLAEESLDELEELCQTAGAEVVGKALQKRERPHPGHYIGKGKIEEIKAAIETLGATGIVCDDELSPAQMRNLNEALNTKVMDRTMLILDIFASRAISAEGKIQVELAQLKYRLSRLTGFGKQLSRLGGGIGARGPGEKKLETDRRYIKERIGELSSSLKDIKTHREVLRASREKKNIPAVALVGYTNAGKSTLLNKLTNADVLAEDKLFATLDTATRGLKLPSGADILLTDTVGFIRKLPHHLIQAFRATLEELNYADALLMVVDASNPNRQTHIDVVSQTLAELGCAEKPFITVFNKADKDMEKPLPTVKGAFKSESVSAKNGDGLERLTETIDALFKSFKQEVTLLIPYADGRFINLLRGKCALISTEHTEKGYLIRAYADDEVMGKLSKYIVD